MCNSQKDKFSKQLNEFNIECIDEDLRTEYLFFSDRFNKLLCSYADINKIRHYYFYIQNNDRFNAFATRDTIGITNGFVILLINKFNEDYFKNILFVALLNNQEMSDGFVDLFQDKEFNCREYFIECSIKYIFHHEFEHMLQFNSHDLECVYFDENLEDTQFSIDKHALEFDADRMASFEVLKYAFGYSRKLTNKTNAQMKCLVYMACSSMILNIYLLNLGLTNQLSEPYEVTEMPFYTKAKTHPHPLARATNILECFYENANNDLPYLDIDPQELLVNVFGIIRIYLDALNIKRYSSKSIMNSFIQYQEDIDKYLDEIYGHTVKMPQIKNILKAKNIKH